MTDLDKKFYEKQKFVPHVGYCSTFVQIENGKYSIREN